jgi:hypothetical protein
MSFEFNHTKNSGIRIRREGEMCAGIINVRGGQDSDWDGISTFLAPRQEYLVVIF